MSNKSWTVILEEDSSTGDLILPLDNEMLKQVGWAEGDLIEWINNKDGSWSLVKASSKTVK